MSLSTTSGFRLLPGRLSPDQQKALLDEVLAKAQEAPFVHQVTPGGKPMSVAMNTEKTSARLAESRNWMTLRMLS